MRALLISANTEQLQMPVLPMGLACVAATAEHAGHDVSLLNLMTKDGFQDPCSTAGELLSPASILQAGNLAGVPTALENAVSGFNPEIVGVSVRNIDDQCMKSPKFLLDAVRKVVTACRGLTSAPIVLGGAGYSMYPQSALNYLGADMGIKGEGEAPFVKLLDVLSRKEDLARVPNLVVAEPSLETRTEIMKRIDDSVLPDPGGLFSFPTEFGNQKIWLPFQTRRGCSMDCSYCSTATIEGRILRKRSLDVVIDSISRFVGAGFKNFFFVDNIFNFPPSYANELCDRLIGKNLEIQWRAILYPWSVDEGLIERMAKAGCVEVSLGFESGSRKVLRSLNKRFEPEDVRSISKMLDKHGIGRMGFLLLGGPAETRQTVEESLEFADSLELEAMKITAGIRIYPYTALAAAAEAEGVVSPGDDLLGPKFYLARGLEGWIDDTISGWLKKRPNWHS
ncbi:Radical SAM domain protein [Syntrophobacter sp. SbD1]|nr:Radical SAM domain protein [Syntrophobacter sp. SbD1]